MTLDEFFEHLADGKGQFQYEVDHQTIRANSQVDAGVYWCPVTYVAFRLSGDYYQCMQWREAATSIELNLDNARLVVGAADSYTRPQYLPLRKRLVKTLGL